MGARQRAPCGNAGCAGDVLLPGRPRGALSAAEAAAGRCVPGARLRRAAATAPETDQHRSVRPAKPRCRKTRGHRTYGDAA